MLLMLGVFCLTCPSVLKGRRHDAADAGALLPHVLLVAETWGS